VCQDAAVRRPQAHDGEVVDTRLAIPDLSADELTGLGTLQAEAERLRKAAAAVARQAWAVKFAERRGLPREQAEQIITMATGSERLLASEFELTFDELGECTVADVVDDPDRYVGETLCDPLEGPAYRGKAKVLKRRDGTLMIHSYAHGEINYRLAGQGVSLDDFQAYLPAAKYIFAPTRELWPAKSVNARIPPAPLLDSDGNPVLDDNGRPISIKPSAWLDRHQAVEQMTWAPGLPSLIEDFLVDHGGWVRRNGARIFNLYKAPRPLPGDPEQVGPWLDHCHRLYPNNAEYIIKWLAHRVQRPGEKLNHALVLGGAQGTGKDSLVAPVKRAVGHANFQEVSPQQVMGRFNAFLKSGILRVSEARDLGDLNRLNRYQLYEHLKPYIAAPPEVLRVDEKNLREYYILNCCAVIITTNYKTDGIYLPADDRRHARRYRRHARPL
jgi:hypothetical protein